MPAYLLRCLLKILRYKVVLRVQYDLLDSETKVQRVRSPVSLKLCLLDIALLG